MYQGQDTRCDVCNQTETLPNLTINVFQNEKNLCEEKQVNEELNIDEILTMYHMATLNAPSVSLYI